MTELPTKTTNEQKEDPASSSHDPTLLPFTYSDPPDELIKLGLKRMDQFITAPEHDRLLSFVESQPWDHDAPGDRDTQQYGAKYLYSAPRKTPKRTDPIPKELDFLVDRLVEHKIMHRKPDQVIVNAYDPGQGIRPHIDHIKHFGPVVVSITLGSPVSMVFELPPRQVSVPHPLVSTNPNLPPRSYLSFPVLRLWLPVQSCLVLSGDSRYLVKHSIDAAKQDRVGERDVIQRGRRISITFRTLNDND